MVNVLWFYDWAGLIKLFFKGSQTIPAFDIHTVHLRPHVNFKAGNSTWKIIWRQFSQINSTAILENPSVLHNWSAPSLLFNPY